MSEYIGEMKMNMNVVMSDLKSWTAKDGSIRYYVNNIGLLIDDWREYNHCELSTFKWDEYRASPGRVRECIEANIIPKSKAYIDENGHVHVYGYAVGPMGEQMDLPKLIEKSINLKFGYCSEKERAKRMENIISKHEAFEKHIGHEVPNGSDAKIGDTVVIMAGRKEVGKRFVITKRSEYHYSQYRRPSIYLYDGEFKVNADNCRIVDVGYSY